PPRSLAPPLHPPPRPPLFPYTTLFRSLFQFVFFPLGVVLIGVAVFFLFGRLASEEHSVPDYVQQISSGSRTERKQAAFALAKALDRKSTRLNSSHVASSYAVFCLNKKH